MIVIFIVKNSGFFFGFRESPWHQGAWMLGGDDNPFGSPQWMAHDGTVFRRALLHGLPISVKWSFATRALGNHCAAEAKTAPTFPNHQ